MGKGYMPDWLSQNPSVENGMGESLSDENAVAVVLHDGREFRQKAKKILTAQTTIAAGCVHLLGLEEIRQTVGKKWEMIEQRVHDLTVRILRRNLSARDAWIRYDNENYLIVFSEHEKAAAQIVCGRIKSELHELLLGKSDTQDITVQTVTIDLDGRMLFESHRLASVLQDFAAKVTAAANCTGCEHLNGDETPPCCAAPQGTVAETEKVALDFVYRPVWDAFAQVTSTYVCEPRLTRPGFNDLRGYAALENAEDFNAILELDAQTLTEGIATFNELFQNRFRYILALPVHFETLANTKRRREYWQVCRMIPKYLTPFITLEMVGLPRGIPFSRLNEIANALRTVCRTITARASEDWSDLGCYAQSGIKAAGLDICPYADGGKVAADIERFGSACRKAGLVAYADGVRDQKALEWAAKAGFKYLSGPIVGPCESYPRHMARCSEKELLMRARVKARTATIPGFVSGR